MSSDRSSKCVSRFEVIDATKKGVGRAFMRYNALGERFIVEWCVQDEGKTLKVFLKDMIVKKGEAE